MNELSLQGVRIESLCACVPANAVCNDEKVARATGIGMRRLAPEGASTVDLFAAAARRAMSDATLAPTDVGAVVAVSFTSSDRMPAVAAQLQSRLGLGREIVAFDVSLACSGFGYGLYLAGLLALQTQRRTLLVTGDVQSAFIASGDGSVGPLLADGAAAMLVGCGGGDVWRFAFASDGAKGDALRLPANGTILMDGFRVFQFVATEVARDLAAFLPSVDGDFTFVPHQPNVYLVRQLAKSVGIPVDRTAISCDALGNLAAASVPVTMAWKGVRGHIVFAGFGGGLSISIGEIFVSAECPLSMVEI